MAVPAHPSTSVPSQIGDPPRTDRMAPALDQHGPREHEAGCVSPRSAGQLLTIHSIYCQRSALARAHHVCALCRHAPNRLHTTRSRARALVQRSTHTTGRAHLRALAAAPAHHQPACTPPRSTRVADPAGDCTRTRVQDPHRARPHLSAARSPSPARRHGVQGPPTTDRVRFPAFSAVQCTRSSACASSN